MPQQITIWNCQNCVGKSYPYTEAVRRPYDLYTRVRTISYKHPEILDYCWYNGSPWDGYKV